MVATFPCHSVELGNFPSKVFFVLGGRINCLPSLPPLGKARVVWTENGFIILIPDGYYFIPPNEGPEPVTCLLRENLKPVLPEELSVGRELLSANLTGSLVSSWKHNPLAKFPTIYILEHRLLIKVPYWFKL